MYPASQERLFFQHDDFSSYNENVFKLTIPFSFYAPEPLFKIMII